MVSEGLSFHMQISLQSSLMMLLSKLAPWSLKPEKLSYNFCSLIRGNVCHNVFCKMVAKDQWFSMFRGWSNPIMVSMLVKSTCSNSKGVVTMMGHTGTLAWLPSCWMHCSQLLITFCICTAIPGHQNWSCSKHSICCWPGIQHPGNIHSWQLLSEPLGLQIKKLPPPHP